MEGVARREMSKGREERMTTGSVHLSLLPPASSKSLGYLTTDYSCARMCMYACVCVLKYISSIRSGLERSSKTAKILLPLHSLEFHLFFPTLLSSRARTEWKFCVAILVQFVTKVGIPIDPFFDASQRNSLEQNGTEQNETVTVRT